MTPSVEAATNAGTVSAIEATPMTIGLVIVVILGVSAIVGAVWTVATIRANDKAGFSKEIKDSSEANLNATNRVEKKVDANHEQVHGRQNESIKADVVLAEKIGEIRGKQELANQILVAMIMNSMKP
jgi:hypothetical protein